ncbi:MAG: septum formation initiator family protein [Gemmatimonadaceae bacterium]
MLVRVAVWVVVAAAVYFALQGGEWSTRDLWKQRARKQALVVKTDSLSREVDSLKKVLRAIQTDRAAQERVAREQFGMVKGDREILYRFGKAADTSGR